MKIAAICLAYLGKPDGVDCLAEYFASTGTSLLVHVDAKVDDTPYRGLVEKWPHVTLLPDRLPIYWGGFNTVRAIIRAFESASFAGSFTRYLVITEDTIPLVSRAQYLNLMSSDVDFIESRKALNPKVIQRYEKFFYFDSRSTSPRPMTTLEREVTSDTLLDLHRLQQLRARGKAVVPAILHGSGWFGLTKPRVDKVVRVYHENSHLRESFEFSAIPEEQYFHTILGEMTGSRRLVFTDFTRSPQPFVFRSPTEFQSLDTKGSLFLRKVALGSRAIRDFVQDLN
jgi:hypothetical protein